MPGARGGLPIRYARDLRPRAAIPLDAISASLHRLLIGTPRCAWAPGGTHEYVAVFMKRSTYASGNARPPLAGFGRILPRPAGRWNNRVFGSRMDDHAVTRDMVAQRAEGFGPADLRGPGPVPPGVRHPQPGAPEQPVPHVSRRRRVPRRRPEVRPLRVDRDR